MKCTAGELFRGLWEVRSDDIGGEERTVVEISKDMSTAKGSLAFAGYGEKIKDIAKGQGTMSANLGQVHGRDCPRSTAAEPKPPYSSLPP